MAKEITQIQPLQPPPVALRRVEMTVVTGVPHSDIPSSNYQVSKQAAELVAGTSIPRTAVANALHEGHGYPLAKISTDQPFQVRENSPVSAVGVHQQTGAVVLYEVQRSKVPQLGVPPGEELALVQRPQTLVAKSREEEEKMVNLVVVMPQQPEKLSAPDEAGEVNEQADRDRLAWAEAILRKY